ncbi:hypothetical protein L596_022593 [Steinernema carpocapsae]|uniref:Uncharacterized protein n=1 Tax=Steinernema carpocapsae TaxID=34508 RepID=A0A4U5MM81_STECR|nr:hypothetical protein L596_022593 [Steinernema carpocapsae]
MDGIPITHWEETFKKQPFSTICSFKNIENFENNPGQLFHDRSFSLYVDLCPKKTFRISLLPCYRDQRSKMCVCEKKTVKVDESANAKKFPDCIMDNWTYFRDIRITIHERDQFRLVVKPGFFPYLKKLLKEPFAQVVTESIHKKQPCDFKEEWGGCTIFGGCDLPFPEESLVREILRYYAHLLQPVNLYLPLKHLMVSAFASGNQLELNYHCGNEDTASFIEALLHRRDMKIYIQDGQSSSRAFHWEMVMLFMEWYNVNNPVYGKYMASGGNFRHIHAPNPKSWVKIENTPLHLKQYLADERYPLFHLHAEKVTFMLPHPKVRGRKLYVVFGIYQEAMEKFRRMKKQNPNFDIDYNFASHECETHFVFFD